MPNKRLMDIDPEYGTKTYFYYDHDNDTFSINTEQTVDANLDVNKRFYNDAPTRWGDGQMVASIPISLYWDLWKKGTAKDQVAFKKWLNDPDNRFFRTRPGTV